MKSTTLCLVLILTAICHQGLCTIIREKENADLTAQLVHPQMGNADIKEAAELLVRDKRHVGLHFCTYCCNCCRNKGCGYCCRT